MTSRSLALFVSIGCLSACAAPAPVPARDRTPLRIAHPAIANFGDLPILMATDALIEQGYTVDTLFLGSSQLAITALTDGEADIGISSTRTALAAIAKGAPITTVMEESGNVWVLAARPGIERCSDLDGRRVGITDTGGLVGTLTLAYLARHCPDVTPKFVLIGTESRAAALGAGELDAGPLELSDLLRLQSASPGRVKTLVRFADVMPRMIVVGVHVNRAYADAHPGAIRDFIRALLTIHRRIQNEPDLLTKAAMKYLKADEQSAAPIVDAYIKAKAWDPNGGMDVQSVQNALDLFAETAGLPKDLTVPQVVDRSHLDAVLDAIGRR